MIDLTGVSEQQKFEPVPAGTYPVRATEAGIKPTKQGNGSYLNVQFTITRGDYEGRKVWTRFNLANPSPKAVEIGKSALKSFLVKARFGDPDHVEVIDIPGLQCLASVVVVTDSQFGDSNDIKYFTEDVPTDHLEFAPPVETTDEVGFAHQAQ